MRRKGWYAEIAVGDTAVFKYAITLRSTSGTAERRKNAWTLWGARWIARRMLANPRPRRGVVEVVR